VPQPRLLFICHKNYSYVNNLNGWLLVMGHRRLQICFGQARNARTNSESIRNENQISDVLPVFWSNTRPSPRAGLLRCPISFAIMSENSYPRQRQTLAILSDVCGSVRWQIHYFINKTAQQSILWAVHFVCFSHSGAEIPVSKYTAYVCNPYIYSWSNIRKRASISN